MAEKLELTDFELDALKETANIGTGNASMALSTLLAKTVDISTPNTAVTKLKNIHKEFSSGSGSVVGMYSSVRDGLEGNILVLLPQNIANKLVEEIRQTNGEEKSSLDQEDITILKKIGSVLFSAYLTGLAKFFEQKIVYKKPSIITTFGSSIADFVMAQIDDEEKVLLINVSFTIKETDIKGDFLLLFTVKSLEPLLETFKKKMGV